MKSLLSAIALFCCICCSLIGQKLDMSLFHGIEPRNIGPAGMSGRVTSIAVNLSDMDIIYLGTAAGGVWKSENSGHTWKPIFENEMAASIGDIAIFQKNPSILYAGTGEGNPRNSQNSGRGMYKSLDGGLTWHHLGLKNTRQIHRVIVHPDDPNIVWAGVAGATWGESSDRGVFKSEDGGQSWRKVLYTNENTGISDLVADPENPNKLLAGMYQHRRWPWFYKSGGPGSALHITYDGGETWKQLTEKNGLPGGELGRIGLAIAPSDPSIVYAYIESKENAVYRSNDGGENWKRVSGEGQAIGGRPFYYADIYVDTQNENRLYSIASEVTVSDDGGKTWSTFAPGNRIHTDHHAWWSHPDDNEFIIIGHDGGLNITHDRGHKWWFADNLPLAQFYHIRVDNEVPYHVMGGLQDNGSWRGPSRTWFKGGIRNMYWQRLSVGDGFDVVPDPLNPEYGYAMGQAGNLVRYHTKSGHLKKIKPVHPDGEYLRFNWNAGIAIDPHDQKTVYYGSQYLMKSDDYGNSWKIISPDLTTNDPGKKNFLESGGLTYDVTGAEFHCTVISVDPSPLDPNIIWAGTDDGNVQVTSDQGQRWTNVIKNIPGVPSNSWVTQISASTYDANSAFVVFDDHRRDNWEPYIFETNDLGETWKRLVNTNDVDGYTFCLAQDPIEPQLMFVGTEFGLYVSFDAGDNWNEWTVGLPTMPVTDLVIHPRDHDLVIGTFGRAIWILDDIRPLREIARSGWEEMVRDSFYFFNPPDDYLMMIGESKGWRHGKIGDAMYNGENRPEGALLSYWYNGDKGESKFEIFDEQQRLIRTLYQDATKGLNRFSWKLDMDQPRSPQQPKPKKPAKPRGGFYTIPGTYTINMIKGTDTLTQDITVKPDPRLPYKPLQGREKMNQYNRYNSSVSDLTSITDDIRLVEKKIGWTRELLEMQESTGMDTVYALLKSMAKDVKKIKESILGKEVQGIYRSPFVLGNQFFPVRSALDHSLSEATANQNIQLDLLDKAIDEKQNEWNQLKDRISSEFSLIQEEFGVSMW